MTDGVKPFDSTRSLQLWLEKGKTVLYHSRSIQCCLHRACCAVARTAESLSLSTKSTSASLTNDDFWKRRSVSAIDRMSELSVSQSSLYSTLPLVGRLIGVGFEIWQITAGRGVALRLLSLSLSRPLLSSADCCCFAVQVAGRALE